MERESDGEITPRIVPVYAHQLSCWEALLTQLEYAKSGFDAVASAYDEYFEDCDPPRPSVDDVNAAIDHVREGGATPQLFTFADRATTEPFALAREIVEKDLGEKARTHLVRARFGSLAKAIYDSEQHYRAAVDQALRWIQNGGPPVQPRGWPVFEPKPEQQLPAGDHDVARLMSEMLTVGRRVLGVTSLPHEGPVGWTNHIIKGWYAYANWKHETPAGTGRIRVNKLLNSTEISEETLRFLLWHEYLHLYLKGGHSHPQFRPLERSWPSAVEGTRAMFNLDERFGIQFW